MNTRRTLVTLTAAAALAALLPANPAAAHAKRCTHERVHRHGVIVSTFIGHDGDYVHAPRGGRDKHIVRVTIPRHVPITYRIDCAKR